MDTKKHKLPWEDRFAIEIHRLRKEASMSQSGLARAASKQGLRFHQQQVDRIERGIRPVRLNEAIVLCLVFSKRLEELVPTELDTEASRELATTATDQYSATAQDATRRVWDTWEELAGAGRLAGNAVWQYREHLKSTNEDDRHFRMLETRFKTTQEAQDRFRKLVDTLNPEPSKNLNAARAEK